MSPGSLRLAINDGSEKRPLVHLESFALSQGSWKFIGDDYRPSYSRPLPVDQFVSFANGRLRKVTGEIQAREKIKDVIAQLHLKFQNMWPQKSDFVRALGNRNSFLFHVNLRPLVDPDPGIPSEDSPHWAVLLLRPEKKRYVTEFIPVNHDYEFTTTVGIVQASLEGNTLIITSQDGGADNTELQCMSFHKSGHVWHQEPEIQDGFLFCDSQFVSPTKIKLTYSGFTQYYSGSLAWTHRQFRRDIYYRPGGLVAGPEIELPTDIGLIDKLKGYRIRGDRKAFNLRVPPKVQQPLWLALKILDYEHPFIHHYLRLANGGSIQVDFVIRHGQMYVSRTTH